MDRPTSSPERDAVGASPKGEALIQEPDRLQRAIARRSAETRATVPDLELSAHADAEPLLRAAEQAGAGTTALLVVAVAAALREHPRANAAYRDGHYELYPRINVAVVMLGEDSQAPVTVLDADTKPAAEIGGELTRLRERVAAGELTSREQSGATFTLTDLGPYGVHRAAGLTTPPQAAALTAGAVRGVPVVRDGAVVAGHELELTLTADHRILFGVRAADFLAAVVRQLEGL